MTNFREGERVFWFLANGDCLRGIFVEYKTLSIALVRLGIYPQRYHQVILEVDVCELNRDYDYSD